MNEPKILETAWYYVREKKKVGPISQAQLQELAVRGELGPADMVLQQGSAKWAPASSVDNLFPRPVVEPAADNHVRVHSSVRPVTFPL